MNNRYKFIESEHLHTLDGKTLIGTSTALKVLAKPLTWWASGLTVAQLGWIKELKPYDKPKPTTDLIEANKRQRIAAATSALANIRALTPDQYLALLDKAYKAHSVKLKKSAGDGTDLHAELEEYVKDCIRHDGLPLEQIVTGSQAVKTFALWALTNVNRFLVSEAHCYSERLWTGGIVDLLYEDVNGRLIIMDFKSSKDAYLSQFFQDAGYDIEISENGVLDKDGNLLLKLERSVDGYAVFPFGMDQPEPQFHFDTAGAREGFEAAVKLHKLLN